MTKDEKEQMGLRRAARLTTRIRSMSRHYNMKWSRRDMLELVARCVRIMDSGEGIDDVDLRVLVRLFNREVIGVRNAC